MGGNGFWALFAWRSDVVGHLESDTVLSCKCCGALVFFEQDKGCRISLAVRCLSVPCWGASGRHRSLVPPHPVPPQQQNPERSKKNESSRSKVESRKVDSESPSESHPINASSDHGIARFESHDSEWLSLDSRFRIADSMPLSSLGGHFGPEKNYLAPPPPKFSQFAADPPSPSAPSWRAPLSPGIFNKKRSTPFLAPWTPLPLPRANKN